MSLFISSLILAVSLSGLLFGLFLALIAPEELRAGRIYFKTAAAVLFLLIILVGSFYFFSFSEYFILTIFLLTTILIFGVELKYELFWLMIINYLLFSALYFLITETNLQLLLACLIFLYGLPIGTLLKMTGEKSSR